MANSPSKVVLIAGAVMGIGAMVVLNSMNKTPKSEEEQEQEQQQAQAAKAPAAAPKPIPVTGTDPSKAVRRPGNGPGNAGDPAKGSDLVGLGQDKVVGTSPAGPEVNVRYSWTPAVQNDPNKVYDAVAAVKSAIPGARVHVVNTDENPGAPDGVFIGSKQIAPAGADGSISVTAAAVKAAVGSGSK